MQGCKGLAVKSAFASSLLLGAIHAHAAGFAIAEHSASGLGTAFASGGTSGEDVSSIYFNPASMGLFNKRQAVAVGHYIIPNAKFKNTGSKTGVFGAPLNGDDGDGGVDAFVPNAYWLGHVDKQLRLGVGLNAPFGLSTEYDDDWVGRYHAIESHMKTVNVNPSFAITLEPGVILGGGFSVQYIDVELTSAVDFGSICVASFGTSACNSMSLAPQQDDGIAEIAGDDISYGWNIGLISQLSEQTRIGLAYRSTVRHTIEGTGKFTVPTDAQVLTSTGAFQNTGATASVTLPDNASLSVHHAIDSQWAMMADVTWTGWSSFQELRVKYDNAAQPDTVTTQKWKDTVRLAVGGRYDATKTMAFRAGVAYDPTPVSSEKHRTPRTPDNNRFWLALGASFILNPSTTVDLGYTHVFIDKSKIDNSVESSIPTIEHELKGEYTSSVDIVSAQVVWTY